MFKKYIYHGFEDFYDYYRDASEILESWNEEFKELDDEFVDDVHFTFEVVKSGGQGKIEHLESRIEKLKESLASIADLDNPNAIKPDYWIDDGVAELVQVITTDTEIARTALREDEKPTKVK